MGTGAVRIEGGFIGIDPRAILHAWSTCRREPAGIGGFRAWLALREMVTRRQGAGADRRPSYGEAELAQLLGVAERTARASLRRLVEAGLVEWSGDAIAFPQCPASDQRLDAIGAGCGVVALPRRLVRFLAKGARPAMVAVALGAVLRCVSRRRSGFGTRGRFKSSWVAEAFGVAERHARSARADLVRLGWLRADPDDASGQWAWNRWGRAFLVHLDWRAPLTDRPTPPADPGASSSYPDLQPGPSPERKSDPEPTECGPAGAPLGQGQAEAVANSGTSIGGQANPPAPDLRDIRPADLADTGRVLALHRQAVTSGRLSASEADRLRFVAAVEHARAVGRQNPCGLFARIVGRGWWHLLTQGDEDRAARRIRDHGRPAPAAPAAPAAPPAAPPRPAMPVPAPFRSPYGAERPPREPSTLAGLLGRLAVGLGRGPDGTAGRSTTEGNLDVGVIRVGISASRMDGAGGIAPAAIKSGPASRPAAPIRPGGGACGTPLLGEV